MTDLPSRFTIERTGNLDKSGRHLGHMQDGRLAWMTSVVHANAYPSEQDAKSFIQHRVYEDARVVRHTVH